MIARQPYCYGPRFRNSRLRIRQNKNTNAANEYLKWHVIKRTSVQSTSVQCRETAEINIQRSLVIFPQQYQILRSAGSLPFLCSHRLNKETHSIGPEATHRGGKTDLCQHVGGIITAGGYTIQQVCNGRWRNVRFLHDYFRGGEHVIRVCGKTNRQWTKPLKYSSGWSLNA